MTQDNNPRDPFREARQQDGVLKCPFQGEEVPMLLRHADVRKATRDWETFSSDAPFRVPIPSEESVRSMRQLPIETNPPEHTEYRAIVEPFFQRPKLPEMVSQVESLIQRQLDLALEKEILEVVNDFALPIQSHALTYLLNVSEKEADTWIGWGIHVFKVDGALAKKGDTLESYLHRKFDEAEANHGEDFFSALTQAEYQGRRLTREEMMGFANLAFAGGRDTIIHSISNIIAYFAEHPEGLDYLREDPKRIVHAGEEFFRVFMPLTHIGRVCPVDTEVQGVKVPAGGRVSMGWASANHDETVFENPDEIRLDRKPNPHLSFGFGPHLCLGALHARLVVRTLMQSLIQNKVRLSIIDAVPHVEREARYERVNGYSSLKARFMRG